MLAVLKWGVGFALVVIVSVPLNGLLISMTWGWFVIPATGARAISIAQGIGLSIFLSIAGSVATTSLRKFDLDGETEPRAVAAKALGMMISVGIIVPVCTLVIAWAWHAFLM